MKIKIENTVLQEAIRVVSRLAPPVSGNIVVKADGKKAYIISQSETAKVVVLLACDVDGEATFGIGMQTLRDATKGRKELEIAYEKTLCKIKSANYKCELATVDALEVEVDESKVKQTLKISADQAQWLKKALATVALKPNPLLQTFMPVAIRLTAKGAFVATYDREHMAWTNSKDITGEFSLVLPFETAQAILDVFHIGALKLELGDANLTVVNKLVTVALALPQEDEEAIGLADVIEQAKEASKADGKSMEIEKAALLGFLDNARAVATKERSEIQFETEKGKVKLKIETTNGSTATVLKASVNAAVKARIDFELMDEAVRKCGTQVIMKLVADAFAVFKTSAESSTVISLNQE